MINLRWKKTNFQGHRVWVKTFLGLCIQRAFQTSLTVRIHLLTPQSTVWKTVPTFGTEFKTWKTNRNQWLMLYFMAMLSFCFTLVARYLHWCCLPLQQHIPTRCSVGLWCWEWWLQRQAEAVHHSVAPRDTSLLSRPSPGGYFPFQWLDHNSVALLLAVLIITALIRQRC